MNDKSFFRFAESKGECVLGRHCSLHLRSFVLGVEFAYGYMKLNPIGELELWRRFRSEIMKDPSAHGKDDFGVYFSRSLSPKLSMDAYLRDWFIFQEQNSQVDLQIRTVAEGEFKKVDLLTFIKLVQKRPAFYVSSRSPTHLKALLSGFCLSSNWYGNLVQPQQELEQLASWLQKQTETSCPWDMGLIIEQVGDEPRAFDHFFKYVDDFYAGITGED